MVTAGGSVGLIATRATLAGRVFDATLMKAGYTSVMPDDDAMDQWVLPGIELVKAGQTLQAAVLIENAVQALLRKGADAVVLACTGDTGCAGRLGVTAARKVRGQHCGFGASLCRLVDGEPREAGDESSPGHARLNTDLVPAQPEL